MLSLWRLQWELASLLKRRIRCCLSAAVAPSGTTIEQFILY